MIPPVADPLPPRRVLLQQLHAQAARIRVLEHEVNHWYLRATYTSDELAEMRRRASLGLDDQGRWLWPDGEKRHPA